MGFHFFIFEFQDLHQSFKFSCQKIREYPQNFQKNQWNPGPKIKKYEWFLMKSDFGDILDKNTGILSIISGKSVYTSGDFTQILKLKFRWYTSVFLNS